MSTLYEQVSDEILGRIAKGDLKVGDRLPREEDFAAELGVSRSTLRLAFADLEASGILRRKKRAGTEIISATPKQRFSMATHDIGELLSLGRDPVFEIFGTATVKTGDIDALDGLVSETGHWLEVHGARTLKGEKRPFSVNRVYVPARFAAIEPVLADGRSSVFQAIETAFGVSIGQVSQRVTAIPCPKAEAKIMGLNPGAPALRITAELFASDGTLMEVSVATFDPDRFQVRTEVRIA